MTRNLYPPIQPRVTSFLDAGHSHQVYYETCGAEDGVPVVFLHGGPGSGCKPDHRQFFDPKRYYIVLFDQRGSGRSKPFGSTDNNTTPHLLDDMEALRNELGIERWLLFGGSWGAALALAYAERHPNRVLGMVLRGTFLAREADVSWFFSEGANKLLPRQWHEFQRRIGADSNTDILATLHERIFSSDRAIVEQTAQAWEAWSGAVVMFSINQAGDGTAGPLETAIAKARIEMHYAFHRYFIEENELLSRIGDVPDVPVRIIHGARDITCPAASAWTLHQAIPRSELEVLRTAGHLSGETPMIDALVKAADDMHAKLASA